MYMQRKNARILIRFSLKIRLHFTDFGICMGGSWVQIPSGARIFFSEFPFDAKNYDVLLTKTHFGG